MQEPMHSSMNMLPVKPESADDRQTWSILGAGFASFAILIGSRKDVMLFYCGLCLHKIICTRLHC